MTVRVTISDRRWLATALATTVLFILAACGQGAADGDAQSVAATQRIQSVAAPASVAVAAPEMEQTGVASDATSMTALGRQVNPKPVVAAVTEPAIDRLIANLADSVDAKAQSEQAAPEPEVAAVIAPTVDPLDTPNVRPVSAQAQSQQATLEPDPAAVSATTVERPDTDDGSANAKAQSLEDTREPEVLAMSAGAVGQLDANAIVAATEEVLGGIYQRVLPVVVHIRVRQSVQGPSSGREFDQRPRVPGLPSEPFRQGEGSGFVWSAEGHIVTNQHVVADADLVTVTFADGTELNAEILGSDPDSDLAVLKVDVSTGELDAVELGDSDNVKVG